MDCIAVVPSGKHLAASTNADCVEYHASADERQKPLPVFEHNVVSVVFCDVR